MNTIKKRALTSIAVCFMACLMFSMPVLAASVARLTPSTKSRTYYVTDFVCENPKGDWYLQIENLGKTYDPNKLYPASTVTATITVTYSY